MARKNRGLWNTPATQAGEYDARIKAGEQQDLNAEKAAKTAKGNNETFMKEVGKEGIKWQKEKMRDEGRLEMSKYLGRKDNPRNSSKKKITKKAK